MQGMALYPLATVEKPAQGGDPFVDYDTCGRFHGVAGAHLVGDGTYAAYARGDVRSLCEVASDQHRLEIAGWLEDLEGDILHDAVPHLYPEGALALDPSEPFDADRALTTQSVSHAVPSARTAPPGAVGGAHLGPPTRRGTLARRR